MQDNHNVNFGALFSEVSELELRENSSLQNRQCRAVQFFLSPKMHLFWSAEPSLFIIHKSGVTARPSDLSAMI